MADSTTRSLRILTVATFLPAFPLLLAHGVVSRDPVPAMGLLPLAFSSSVGVFLLARYPPPSSTSPEDGEQQGEGEEGPQTAPTALRHPFIVFTVDAILAAGLLVVLVFTWITTGKRLVRAELPMLAAYGTIPLLLNFLVHLYLAVRELYIGFAVHDLIQWVAYQAVPPDCPNCNQRVRPETRPSLPWLESLPKVTLPPLPTLPKINTSEWKTPAWLRGRRNEETANLLVQEDPEIRYRDDPEDEGETSHA